MRCCLFGGIWFSISIRLSLTHTHTHTHTPPPFRFGSACVLLVRYGNSILLSVFDVVHGECNVVAMAKMQIYWIAVWAGMSRKLRHVPISRPLAHTHLPSLHERVREGVCVCGRNCKNVIKLQIYLSFRCDNNNNRQEKFPFSMAWQRGRQRRGGCLWMPLKVVMRANGLSFANFAYRFARSVDHTTQF